MQAHQIETCDFKATEAKARKMSDEALDYVINDCREAATCAESFDRAGMPNNGASTGTSTTCLSVRGPAAGLVV